MKKKKILFSFKLTALVLMSVLLICLIVSLGGKEYEPKSGVKIAVTLNDEKVKQGERLTATFAFDEEPKNWRYDLAV
jgi:hypothetical protein